MICLGIESTAHTFGVGIVTDKGEIIADAKDTYKPKLGSGFPRRPSSTIWTSRKRFWKRRWQRPN